MGFDTIEINLVIDTDTDKIKVKLLFIDTDTDKTKVDFFSPHSFSISY